MSTRPALAPTVVVLVTSCALLLAACSRATASPS